MRQSSEEFVKNTLGIASIASLAISGVGFSAGMALRLDEHDLRARRHDYEATITADTYHVVGNTLFEQGSIGLAIGGFTGLGAIALGRREPHESQSRE